MDLGLTGKVALITGASKGLGKAIAIELANEGAHVSICARGQEALDETAAALRKQGATVVATCADVTQTADAQRVVDATIQQLGRIDILVNNAGDIWMDRTIETTDEEWQYCMDVNFYSAVRFTRAVVPHMREQGGGRIINISTVGARMPLPGCVDYNSAKTALLGFSKTMAEELGPDGILVNSVCPAIVASPMLDKLADQLVPAMGRDREEVLNNLANQFSTLNRCGREDEVSGLIAFLASERATYITGSVYDVDGGFNKGL
ncbi:MAG: SDR family NAD(P)-dependent oxidoreductase [Gammaproteobacteria bacterium]